MNALGEVLQLGTLIKFQVCKSEEMLGEKGLNKVLTVISDRNWHLLYPGQYFQ